LPWRSVLTPLPISNDASKSSGMPFVRMSTLPPPKLAGRSGDHAFWTLSDSTMDVGNTSSGMTLRVRSGEGICAPLRELAE
jgi:hypothetical protein